MRHAATAPGSRALRPCLSNLPEPHCLERDQRREPSSATDEMCLSKPQLQAGLAEQRMGLHPGDVLAERSVGPLPPPRTAAQRLSLS